MHLRSFHRGIAVFIGFIVIFIGVTGTLIQLHDLWTLFRQAPAEDPGMASIREGFNGPPAFQVIANADYTAAVLPSTLDLEAALSTVLRAARRVDQSGALRLLELRMIDGKAVGHAKFDEQALRFDALSGERTPGVVSLPNNAGNPPSLRNTIKSLHRMTTFGDWSLWINVLVALSLLAMNGSGLVMYFRLTKARARINRTGMFWFAGGWWRTLHRAIALSSAVFLMVVAVSGAWLAFESLMRAVNIARNTSYFHGVSAPVDVPAPVADADVPGMSRTVLAAYRTAMPGRPIKALRLRSFGNMVQGVFITGGEETEQVVFDAVTGRRASLTEPEYPITAYPFGWQAHQTAKHIHRGDIIGLSGRWMDLFAGFSLVYLSISGLVMYYEMWNKRRRIGRSELLWK